MRGRPEYDKPTDRMERSDWWGVVLETPDPSRLGHFYADLLDWKVATDTDHAACEGEQVTFHAQGSNIPATYQWQIAGPGADCQLSAGWTDIPVATAPSIAAEVKKLKG